MYIPQQSLIEAMMLNQLNRWPDLKTDREKFTDFQHKQISNFSDATLLYQIQIKTRDISFYF